MAELVGAPTVFAAARAARCLADFNGSLGESGIVGSSIPIATGAALSSKVLGNGKVALAFFGDGAANQGCLYESMNLAGAWDLPVVFLCENNQYALSTPAHTVTSGVIADRAAGFGMPGVRVEDGQEVLAVTRPHVAVERARRGEGPSLVEVVTYRFNEHPKACASADYRDKDEKAARLERDPTCFSAAGSPSTATPPRAARRPRRRGPRGVSTSRWPSHDASPFPDPSRAFADLAVEPFGPTHVEHGPAPIGADR
jgi:pyruvate dehydrogenase E1 component alpha subunit